MTTAVATHVEKALDYARGVVAGEIPNCQWVRLACERFLRDLAREDDPAWPYELSHRKAEKICSFAEEMPHVKGEWANRHENIRLEPWQCFILVNVFGWVDKRTGYRRFREAYIEVPRKNAKSSLSSVVGLYMLAMDGEEGAGVYSAATTRDQARITFDDGAAMVRKKPDFATHYGVEAGKLAITVASRNASWKPITRESSANEGLNVHCGLLDELHAHKNRDVYGVVRQGMGARRQPLMWMITTAGSDQTGVCYEQRQGITQILLGTSTLETSFGVIYTLDLDQGDDPFDPAVWPKSNPNFGVSVYPEDMKAAAAKAQLLPGERAEYLTKRHNIWVTAADPYFDAEAWGKLVQPHLTQDVPAELDGKPAYVGLYLVQRREIAALNIVFPLGERMYAVFGRYYLPAVVAQEKGGAYPGWASAGWLTLTPGDTTDYEFIKRDLLAWTERFDVKEVTFDPREARQLATELLNEHGIEMIELRRGYAYNEAMKELDSLIAEQRLAHNGDPILAWAVSNVVGKTGAYGDVMPTSDTEEARLEPALATLMALSRALQASPQNDWHGIFIPEDE